jgi:hypothetical protein
MSDRTPSERAASEHGIQHTGRERAAGAALWVVLAVSLSMPLGGAVAGYLLDPAGFSALDPWFLFFSLVSLTSVLLDAAGTTLMSIAR